jgi:predicted nucleic acid-binding protein
MGIIFDTSAIIAVERGHESLDALIAGREEEAFGISAVTAAELLHGVDRADTEERKLRRQAFVEKVIESFPVFPFDLMVARIYARIWAAIARKGGEPWAPTTSSSLPPPFLWITPSPRSTFGVREDPGGKHGNTAIARGNCKSP